MRLVCALTILCSLFLYPGDCFSEAHISDNEVLDFYLESILKSSDEYEAGRRWDEIRQKIDFENPVQIQKWLTLQKMMLESPHRTLPLGGSPSGIKQSAIQEFYFYFEQAMGFEEWLQECKTKKIFLDPFINQNINRTLEAMRKYRTRNAQNK